MLPLVRTPEHRKDFKRSTRSNTNRKGSRSLLRETSSPLGARARSGEGSEGSSNCATVSIDKTRTDDGFIRVKVFNSQVSGKSVTRPACQRSLVCSTRRLVVPHPLASRHPRSGDTGEPAEPSLPPSPRRGVAVAVTRHVLCGCRIQDATPLARRYP